MSIESAFAKAERLRKNVEQHGFAHIDKLTISIGISHWTGTDQSLHKSIRKADDALYRAKRNGRNRCEVNV